MGTKHVSKSDGLAVAMCSAASCSSSSVYTAAISTLLGRVWGPGLGRGVGLVSVRLVFSVRLVSVRL